MIPTDYVTKPRSMIFMNKDELYEISMISAYYPFEELGGYLFYATKFLLIDNKIFCIGI